MSMDEEIKRWAAKLKSAPMQDVTQGKVTIPETSRAYDPALLEEENWSDEIKRGMENAMRVNPLHSKSRRAPTQQAAVLRARQMLESIHPDGAH